MKVTLNLDSELVTNWAFKNGLAKVDWATEDKNAYNNRELENPEDITLEFDVYSEPDEPEHNYRGGSEFYNFKYIDDKGNGWPVDIDITEIKEIITENLEKQ